MKALDKKALQAVEKKHPVGGEMKSLADLKAVPGSAAEPHAGPTLREASVELRQRNLAFFAKNLPGLHKALLELKPTGELVWGDKDDANICHGNVFAYKKGARQDTAEQLKAFTKRPTRVVFAKPEHLFDDVEGAVRPDAGTYAFATQRYDDRNTDDHSERFVRHVGQMIKDHGIKITDGVAREKNPYYLVSYGIGLGFHVMPLLEYYEPEIFVLLEDNLETIHFSTFTFDWEKFWAFMHDRKKKIRIIFEKEALMMLQKLNGTVGGECLLGLDGVMSYTHTQSPVLQVVFNEFNSAKTANLASFIGFIVDEFNMMKNSFRNLRAGTKRVLSTIRRKAKVPVIIVGSGPSLEESIEWLRSVQDKAVIISSGSSMAALLQHGIKPDFQAVLERAKAVYDRHKEAAELYDYKDVHVVLTTTIWPGIDAFFKDVVYFFRPALSPLGVFCNDNAEILNGEGPQVTNTAFAFSRRLDFSEYYLLGIDLGAADPSHPRAEKAWVSPDVKQRDLHIPVRGNFGRTVFTDRSLTQQRQTIETQIRSLPGGPVFNLSNGVRITGATPKHPSEVDLAPLKEDKKKLVQELVDQFPVYTRERFIGAWESSGVRENVAEMISGMIKALQNSDRWDNQLLKKIEDLNAYNGKQLRKQYAPRLLRGSLLRICMYINTIFMRFGTPEKEQEFFGEVREYLIDYLKQIEREAYALADELENEDEYFGVKYI